MGRAIREGKGWEAGYGGVWKINLGDGKGRMVGNDGDLGIAAFGDWNSGAGRARMGRKGGAAFCYE